MGRTRRCRPSCSDSGEGEGSGGGGGGRGERAVAAAVPRSGEGVSTPGDRTAGPRREVAASWRGLR